MDFMNRGGQARTNNVASNSGGAAQAPAAGPKPAGDGHSKWLRVGFLILLFAGTLLAVASLLFLAFGKGAYKESKLVNTNQLQAVFINVNGTNGGQVYFGNVKELTPSFIRLKNVFYIQNQQANAQSTASYNLVKLGCELHGPEDEMVINRSEVFFWENLKADSQVAQKVAEFHKQNPNGQKCNTNEQSADQQSGNTQQPATTQTTPPAATTPANNTGNKPATNNTNNANN